MAKVKEMTSGRPMGLIIKFAIPLILGNMLQQAYSLIDAGIVGRTIGIGALAAVGASSSVLFLIIGFCNGCSGGFGIPIAQCFGARDYSRMRNYVNVSIKLACIISVSLAIITSILCRQILNWMKTPQDILQMSYWYLLITFLGIPATFLYNLFSSILRALGDSKTPFWFLMLSTILNIILDLLFILGFHWGVAGASIATLISQATSAILCFVFMKRSYDVLQYKDDSEKEFSHQTISRLLNIGVPMGLQFSITAIGSMMLQASNNALGTACVAAFTAAMRIKMFFICAFENLGVAMATYCGQNYGAGLPQRILHGIKDAFIVMVIYALFCAAILWPLAYNIATIFVGNEEIEVLNNVELFLHCSVTFYIILGTLCILRYSIQGMGYTKLSMLSGVSEMIARVLVSLLAVPSFGYIAVCFGDPTAWCAAVLFLVPAFLYVYRKANRELVSAV